MKIYRIFNRNNKDNGQYILNSLSFASLILICFPSLAFSLRHESFSSSFSIHQLEPLTCNPDTEFRCVDGSSCIELHKRCNSQEDCADSSDEQDCGEWIAIYLPMHSSIASIIRASLIEHWCQLQEYPLVKSEYFEIFLCISLLEPRTFNI